MLPEPKKMPEPPTGSLPGILAGAQALDAGAQLSHAGGYTVYVVRGRIRARALVGEFKFYSH